MLDPYAAFPAELKALRRWIGYKREPKPGKPGEFDKKPKRCDDPAVGAATTRPNEWTDFASAVAAHQRHPDLLDGLGFVFWPADGYVGVDLDDAFRPDRTLKPWAAEIVDALRGAYVELSPSREGLHLIARGTIPDGQRKKAVLWDGEPDGDVEMYASGRYFTVTGWAYGR